MNVHAVGHAQWHAHVNGVRPNARMREWLTDKMSMTQKLIACSTHFNVLCLRQDLAQCLADEVGVVALPRRTRVQQREVLLHCDGRPLVYGHSIVPLNATASDWPFFNSLGERPLGKSLFGDPRVKRGALQYARLRLQHPLMRRLGKALGRPLPPSLFARRCLYKRRNGILLVTEVFLPEIAYLDPVIPQKVGIYSNESIR